MPVVSLALLPPADQAHEFRELAVRHATVFLDPCKAEVWHRDTEEEDSMSMTGSTRSVVLQSGEGYAFNFLGVPLSFKVKGENTGGAFTMFEVTAPPLDPGVAVHRHEQTDEGFYVLEGTLHLEIDGQEMMLGPGAFALVPRGTPHRQGNGGDKPLRVLNTMSPSAPSEGYFEAMAGLIATMPPGPPPADRMHELYELAERYDTFFVTPG